MFFTSTPLGSVIQITYERVLECRAKTPHRIDFVRTRPDQPKRANDPKWVGSFSVPFEKTIGPLFRAGTGLDLIHKKNSIDGKEVENYFLSIRSEEDFKRVQDWVVAQRTQIFLRDCLDLSLALDYNIALEEGAHTILGALEHKAKVDHDPNALDALSGELVRVIQQLPFYRDATKVMAVPPAIGKTYDLPGLLVERTATELSKEDITSKFAFQGEKGKIKDCVLEDKWRQLEAAKLHYSGSGLAGACVILIDDKYQSGTTMQYVAMKLQEAGAKRIYGISLVKTLRDGDNVATK